MSTAIKPSSSIELAASQDGAQPSTEEKGDIVELTAAYTEEEERRVLRKIDCTILPMMCFVFFLQYLDKQTLSYSSVCFDVFTTNARGEGAVAIYLFIYSVRS